MAGRRLVELGVDRLLDLHLLRDRLDHDVDVAEPLVVGRPGDQPHHLVEAGVGGLLGDLLLLDQAGRWDGHLSRLVERGVDELLLDVLDDDRDVCGRDHLRDLAAHGAAAEHGGLEDEHFGEFLPVGERVGTR